MKRTPGNPEGNELEQILRTLSFEELIEVTHGFFGICVFADIAFEQAAGIDFYQTLEANLEQQAQEAALPKIRKAIQIRQRTMELVGQRLQREAESN